MNVHPSLWGNDAWEFFYYIALSYPKNPTPEEKDRYKNFFMLAGSVVPCAKCRKNFVKHFQELPIEEFLDSSYNLFTWVNTMHNKVRKKQKKQEFSVDDSFKYFMSQIQGKKQQESLISTKEYILLGIGVLIIVLYLLKKKWY